MSKKMTGSLSNRLLELGVNGQPDPVVGMGVTELLYTDRLPWQVTRIDGKKVYIKPCTHIYDKPGSAYGHGGAVIDRAEEREIRQKKNGQWCVIEGGRVSSRIIRLEKEGPGRYYYDPGF